MRAPATLMKMQTGNPRTTRLQVPHTARRQRLIDLLQSLDDRTLSQIGIERDEIERFAHAEVAHNL